LRPLDRWFADFIGRLSGCFDERLWWAAALASRALGRGNICLDLRREPGRPLPGADGDEDIFLPAVPGWVKFLRSRAAAGAVGAPGEGTPLVLDPEGRLYLRRYWDYQEQTARRLLDLARPLDNPVFPPGLGKLLRGYFPSPPEQGGDRQRLAAFAALRRRLTVISGGPGTGKTYTLARIIALLLSGEGDQKILLAAPTGKAASRVQESIREALDDSGFPPELRDRVPREAATLHRLLGYRPGAGRFRHDADLPLDAGAVIVDEASMIDLPLMAKLLAAVPSRARLILLGDMDQLASVEPGFVLGDICAAAAADSFSEAFLSDYRSHAGLDLGDAGILAGGEGGLGDSLVRLEYSRRFPPDGQVARLSRAVREARTDEDAGRAWAILSEEGPAPAVARRNFPLSLRDSRGRPHSDLAEAVRDGYREFLAAPSPEAAFAALRNFRVLCSHRRGPHGVEEVNRLIEEILFPGPRPFRSAAGHYHRRLVLITRNDYGLDLHNGDPGLLWAGEGGLRAYFEPGPGEGGNCRQLPPGLLPGHETAFALTVHKAQGSEFARVLLLVPPVESPLLTRELIYTALTRARHRAEFWCAEETFRRAVLRRVERDSGLTAALRA